MIKSREDLVVQKIDSDKCLELLSVAWTGARVMVYVPKNAGPNSRLQVVYGYTALCDLLKISLQTSFDMVACAHEVDLELFVTIDDLETYDRYDADLNMDVIQLQRAHMKMMFAVDGVVIQHSGSDVISVTLS